MQFTLLTLLLTGNANAGCEKDTDCKGDRICIDEECSDPGARLGADSQPSMKSDEQAARVCFRRPAGMSGWAVPLAVRQDGELLERFAVGNQKCFDIDPGAHEFGALYWAKMDVADTRPAATAQVSLAPGDCRYFKAIMGFTGVILAVTDERKFIAEHTCHP